MAESFVTEGEEDIFFEVIVDFKPAIFVFEL